MTDHEIQERTKALALLAELLGHKLSTAAIAMYVQLTGDIELSAFRSACQRAAVESKFFPRPVELRAMCGVTAGNLATTDRVTIAWAAVKAAVAREGGYATVTFDDPIINATIRALGGWVRVCDTESGEQFDAWLRKEFERTYTAFMAAGVQHDQAGPLVGLVDIANGATGHDERQTPRAIETGLPAPAKHLVRGESPKQITSRSEVKRLSVQLGEVVRSLDLPDEDERPAALSADEQRKQLAEWQAKRRVV